MMRRKDNNGQVTEEFKNGVDDFIEIAKRQLGVADVLGRIFCPCFKCKNCVREKPFWVEKHLYEHGFMENYLIGLFTVRINGEIVVQCQMSMMKRWRLGIHTWIWL
jgi:hypothetical protein